MLPQLLTTNKCNIYRVAIKKFYARSSILCQQIHSFKQHNEPLIDKSENTTMDTVPPNYKRLRYDTGPPVSLSNFPQLEQSSLGRQFNDNYNNLNNYSNLNNYNNYNGNNMNFNPSSSLIPPPPPKTVSVSCGALREKDDGLWVEMSGRVTKQRMGRFLELKDKEGVTQLVANDARPEISKSFQKMPIDSYVRVIGVVRRRPIASLNKMILTGGIEVHVNEFLKVTTPKLSEASMLKRAYSTISSKISRNITSIEYKNVTSQNLLEHFKNRETTCGELRLNDVGKVVRLVGWLDSKRHGRFLHIRDGYGYTQIVIDTERVEIKVNVAAINEASIIHIIGKVIARPVSSINPAVSTGEIEVEVDELEILDPNKPYDGPILEDNFPNGDSFGRPSVPKVNNFTSRTHTCNELTTSHVGTRVTLCGWLEYSRMQKFFTLRDGYGCTQVICPDELSEIYNLDKIPFESILKVNGIVMARPPGMINDSMTTGAIEVTLEKLEVLNLARKNLPIQIRDHNRSKDALRMEYRYIDLRCSDMQKNLRLRSKVIMKMREYLINNCGFVEVETPTLFRRTPGGAQEFVVPTRKVGQFYSLVQSPQQFKQMLMVGAIDRYFQVARCYRDESTRPDRQPEFTQLDVELSFTNREGIMSLIEGILVNCWPDSNGALSIPFPKMTYEEAMEKYGCDKPDTTFDLTMKNVTNLVRLHESLMGYLSNSEFASYAIVAKKPNGSLPLNLKKALDAIKKNYPKVTFISSKIATTTIMEWVEGPLSNFLSDVVTKSLAADLNLEPNDLLLMAFGKKTEVQLMMGKIRLALMESLENRKLVPMRPKDGNQFFWVVDFPMFGENEETNAIESMHHPFTAPHPEDAKNLDENKNIFSTRSLAFDLVLNGQEVGGGSVRIHNPKLQKKVLEEILKIDHEHLSHLIEALDCGCPPHGGFAIGIDRLMALICNTTSIRDVIAFPKTLDGKDLLSKAPVPISDEEKKIYHIEVVDKESNEKVQLNSTN